MHTATTHINSQVAKVFLDQINEEIQDIQKDRWSYTNNTGRYADIAAWRSIEGHLTLMWYGTSEDPADVVEECVALGASAHRLSSVELAAEIIDTFTF